MIKPRCMMASVLPISHALQRNCMTSVAESHMTAAPTGCLGGLTVAHLNR
jgi:hypothetical protein